MTLYDLLMLDTKDVDFNVTFKVYVRNSFLEEEYYTLFVDLERAISEYKRNVDFISH